MNSGSMGREGQETDEYLFQLHHIQCKKGKEEIAHCPCCKKKIHLNVQILSDGDTIIVKLIKTKKTEDK